LDQERARIGAGAAVGKGVTLRTHDFECIGKAGKEATHKFDAAAVAASDIPVAPKLDLVRMRARAGAEGGIMTERAMNRVLQVRLCDMCTPCLSCDIWHSAPPRRPSPYPARGQMLLNCACGVQSALDCFWEMWCWSFVLIRRPFDTQVSGSWRTGGGSRQQPRRSYGISVMISFNVFAIFTKIVVYVNS
jgi:hypothetical protein